ncbi:hypothetical protein D3Z50_07035 [Clostridiaceae bacterium]|nr:hypothetical protein [Clostridiaceae bacterium]
MKRTIQIYYLFFVVLLSVSGLIITVLLFADRNADHYFSHLYLLPLFYTCYTMGTVVLVKRVSVSISIFGIVGMYFIKDVLNPFFLMLGDYQTMTKNTEIFLCLDKAIALMIYETTCVYILLIIMAASERHIKKRERSVKAGVFFRITISLMILLIGGIIVVYPSLAGRFHTIMEIGKPETYIPVRSWRVSGREPLGLVDTFMRALFTLVQIIFPAYFVVKIHNKYGKRHQTKAIVYMLLTVGCLFFVMTGENANTVFAAVAVLIMICALYFERIRKFIPIIVTGGLLIVITALLGKGGAFAGEDRNLLYELSQIFNAYFGGVANVAAACLLKETSDQIYLAADFFRSLPFISSIFSGMAGRSLVVDFNDAFWGFTGRSDQLLPSVGQGALYFGYIYAPVIPCFFVMLTMKLEKLAKGTANYYLKYYFYYVTFVMLILLGGNNLTHFYRYAIRFGMVFLIMQTMSVKMPRERSV